VLRARESARLLIVGQAPGTRVDETGIPWNDPGGDRLRCNDWFERDAAPALRRAIKKLFPDL